VKAGAVKMSLSSSNPQASAAKVARSRTSNVGRIAKEIVDLVERTDGPVPLNRIDEQVVGFRAPCAPNWSYSIPHNTGEVVIWNGMTKPGAEALRYVLDKRQVALQLVNVLPYVFEDVRLLDPAWQPVVLLPKRAANFDGPLWLFRVPPALAPQMALRVARDDRYRPLTPKRVGFTADCFWGFEEMVPRCHS
jgi:hypothetical protein